MNATSQKTFITRLTSFLLMALFFTLPFERIPTFEFGGFTVKISYIIGVILILFYTINKILSWILGSSPRMTKVVPGMTKIISGMTISDKLLLAFWFFSLLGSIVTSSSIKRSIIILCLWAFVFLLYIFLSRLVSNPETREKVYKIILFSSVLVCLFGIFQFIGDSFGLSTGITGLRFEYTKAIMGFPRIQSVALEPLYFANFLLVPFFISIVKYIQNRELFRIYFWISILLLTNIILAISRGAYIALGIGLFLFMIYLLINRSRDNYLNKFIGLVIIIILSGIISFVLIYKLNGKQASNNFAQHSVVENVQADGSAFDRIGSYKIAFDNFKTEPVLGTGTGSFGVLTKQADGKKGYGIVNNEYLEILSENGLVGFLLFIAFLVAFAWECKNCIKNINSHEKLMLIGLFFGLLAIFIQYNFFSTLYIIYIWAFLALLKSYSVAHSK